MITGAGTFPAGSRGPHVGAAFFILALHAAAAIAIVAAGHARVVVEKSRALLVAFVPQAPAPREATPPLRLAPPTFRPPEVPLPALPRVEIAVAQIAEPAKAQPVPATISAPAPAAPIAAMPSVAQPPRYDLAYLDNPPPVYPPLSRKLHEEGRVVLRVRVDANGRVEGLEVATSSGFARLDEAALAAVSRWRFAPARAGAQATAGVALVPLSFHLQG